MKDNIQLFPMGSGRRTRLNLSKYRVPCQISDRWLQFQKSATPLRGGDFMHVDVMTIGSDDKDHLICKLVLTKQDLLRMLDQVETTGEDI